MKKKLLVIFLIFSITVSLFFSTRIYSKGNLSIPEGWELYRNTPYNLKLMGLDEIYSVYIVKSETSNDKGFLVYNSNGEVVTDKEKIKELAFKCFVKATVDGDFLKELGLDKMFSKKTADDLKYFYRRMTAFMIGRGGSEIVSKTLGVIKGIKGWNDLIDFRTSKENWGEEWVKKAKPLAEAMLDGIVSLSSTAAEDFLQIFQNKVENHQEIVRDSWMKLLGVYTLNLYKQIWDIYRKHYISYLNAYKLYYKIKDTDSVNLSYKDAKNFWDLYKKEQKINRAVRRNDTARVLIDGI